MKTSHLLGGLGAIIATLTSISSARADDERWPRWYIGLTGGYTFMQDQDVSGGNRGATKLNMNGGYGIGGSIGYLPSSSIPIINALRFEAEVTYHSNKIHSVDHSNGTTGAASGNYSSTAYMANMFYDLPIPNSPWSPYIGAGIGLASVDLAGASGTGNTSDNDNQFAYQFLAGLGYSPVTIPNTQWTLGYRYLATTNPSFSSTGSADVETKYGTHSIEAGLKLRF